MYVYVCKYDWHIRRKRNSVIGQRRDSKGYVELKASGCCDTKPVVLISLQFSCLSNRYSISLSLFIEREMGGKKFKLPLSQGSAADFQDFEFE